MARPQFDNRTWGGLALRGLVAIAFGILALSRPGGIATGLVYLFGVYVFLDGIFALAASVNVAQMGGRWGAMFLLGIAGMIIGVLTFVYPTATALGLVYYIAVWAVLTGILEIAAAVRLRKIVQGEWMLAVAGVLSIACGIVIGARPGTGMLALVSVVGVYALILGVLLIALAFRLRGAQQRLATA
jgi:uncharacterized membrane protein HdeD (DUF308 family)